MTNTYANIKTTEYTDEEIEAMKREDERLEQEARAVYRKGSEYPNGGTAYDFVRRVTYKTIGNCYINYAMDPWELAESIISAADLMAAEVDMTSEDLTWVGEIEGAITSHIETMAMLYDVY